MTAEGKIKQCSIVLTRDCNLRCTFCYVKSAGYVADNRIEYDDLKSIVNFAVKQKSSIYSLPEENLLHTHIFRKFCSISKQDVIP